LIRLYRPGDSAAGELKLIGPDGRPFATSIELVKRAELEHQRAERFAAKLGELGIEPD